MYMILKVMIYTTIIQGVPEKRSKKIDPILNFFLLSEHIWELLKTIFFYLGPSFLLYNLFLGHSLHIYILKHKIYFTKHVSPEDLLNFPF